MNIFNVSKAIQKEKVLLRKLDFVKILLRFKITRALCRSLIQLQMLRCYVYSKKKKIFIIRYQKKNLSC